MTSDKCEHQSPGYFRDGRIECLDCGVRFVPEYLLREAAEVLKIYEDYCQETGPNEAMRTVSEINRYLNGKKA